MLCLHSNKDMFLHGNDTHVPTSSPTRLYAKTLQTLFTFFFSLSLASTFPACEGGFAGIPLSVCKWKQSLSSESSIFVITLVTVTVAHQ